MYYRYRSIDGVDKWDGFELAKKIYADIKDINDTDYWYKDNILDPVGCWDGAVAYLELSDDEWARLFLWLTETVEDIGDAFRNGLSYGLAQTYNNWMLRERSLKN